MNRGIVGTLVAGAVVIGTMAPAFAAQPGPVGQPHVGAHAATSRMRVHAAGVTPATGSASISGTVTVPAGEDAGNVDVTLVDANNNYVTDTFAKDESGTTSTAAYSFANLASGSYKVLFDASETTQLETQWWTGSAAGATDVEGAASIAVTDTTSAPSTDATLAAGGGAVQGTMSGDDADIASGNAFACAFRKDTWQINWERCVQVATDGTYTLPSLRPGTFVVGYITDGSGKKSLPVGGKQATAFGRTLWYNSKADYNDADQFSVADAATTSGISDDVSVTAGTPTFPQVTGNAVVGQKLSVSTGVWPAGVNPSYLWYAGGVPISGATGSTFTPTATQLGKRISVDVYAMAGFWFSIPEYMSATAGTVAPGTLTASSPTISGTPAVGYSLTANHRTWTSGTSFTYKWFANGAYITGSTSTSPSFKLTSAQQGKNITTMVIGKKAGYTTVSKTSGQTWKVALTSNPIIVGTLSVGHTLSVHTGTWTRGTTFQYQWYANGVAIRGATAHSFRLTSAQRYKTIKVRVTGRLSGYATVTRWTASTARIS